MSHVIVAELVANVATVVVNQGDTVEPEDILVILESMKMEIPVLAEVYGIVAELAVIAGEVIREGDIIAVIDTGGST
jgi:acetyl-CoA carboxylase biotin carboxyl carrier protein